MSRPRSQYSERIDICLYPERGDDRCGNVYTYRTEGCSDSKCCQAWREYQADRKRDRAFGGVKRKVWQWPHGTIECYQEGCACEFCDQALRWHQRWEDAEDHVLRNIPGIKTNAQIRRDTKRPRIVQPKHGTHGRYRKGCRCSLCKLASRVANARYRDFATLPDLQKELIERVIQAEARVQTEIEKILSSDPVQPFSLNDMYALPETCPRNAAEAESRNAGRGWY